MEKFYICMINFTDLSYIIDLNISNLRRIFRAGIYCKRSTLLKLLIKYSFVH